jgi:L-ascorbate metabolism protein UlaG (beta-lactamase superfamily)
MPIVTTGHAARRLARRGFHQTCALDTWDTQSFSSGGAELTVTAVPARHSGTSLDRVILPPVMGSVLEYRSSARGAVTRVYLSGDTVVHRDLLGIRERFPRIDLAVLHLGGTRVLGLALSMDDRQGVELLRLLRPAGVVPVHFDDYGRFTSPVSNFLSAVADHGPDVRVRLLRRGESLPLGSAL